MSEQTARGICVTTGYRKKIAITGGSDCTVGILQFTILKNNNIVTFNIILLCLLIVSISKLCILSIVHRYKSQYYSCVIANRH